MSTETNAISASRQGNRLADDLRRIVGDADELLREIADATVDELSTTRNRFERKLSEARHRVDHARRVLGRQAARAAAASNEYIRKNPWKILGWVSLAGLVAALVLKCRSVA